MSKISVEQMKAARALLRWRQADLAERSGVSLPTIGRIESSEGVIGGYATTETAIRNALELAGIEFIGENDTSAGTGPGVRLKA